jgi:3D (Asp-Asp-Asp) domain-containing protein
MKNEIPLWFKVVYVLSIIIAFYFFMPVGVKEKVMIKDKVVEVNKAIYNAVPREKILGTFIGQLTGYGPDCKDCSGFVNGGKNGGRMDVRNGNIYYYDDVFGKVRILAADQKYYKLGTIIRITAPNVLSSPILGIVLDSGGAIKGNIIDLLFENEQATKFVGRQRDVKYEILRYGF